MSTNDYKQMRADFLEQFGSSLCQESRDEVADAPTLKAFIALLHRYMHFLCFKGLKVPTTEWVRKWFRNELAELNKNGVFLDQILALEDPATDSVILLGTTNINVILTKSRTVEFTLEDSSQLHIVAYYSACCNVRLKSADSNANIIHKTNNAKVKIRRV